MENSTHPSIRVFPPSWPPTCQKRCPVRSRRRRLRCARGVRAGGVSIAERLNVTGVVKRQAMTRLYGVFAHRLYAGVTPLYYMAETMPGVNPDSSMKPFFGQAFGDTPLFRAD